MCADIFLLLPLATGDSNRQLSLRSLLNPIAFSGRHGMVARDHPVSKGNHPPKSATFWWYNYKIVIFCHKYKFTGEQVPFDKPCRAIPLWSAQTESHNTIELQQTTVEHIALMHQFHCTKWFNTCKTQKHSINKEEKKVTWNPQLHCARSSSRIRRQSDDARNRRASEPTFLRNGTSADLKKQCVVQILTFKSHPWCSSSNEICQEWLAKHNTMARHLTSTLHYFFLYASLL